MEPGPEIGPKLTLASTKTERAVVGTPSYEGDPQREAERLQGELRTLAELNGQLWRSREYLQATLKQHIALYEVVQATLAKGDPTGNEFRFDRRGHPLSSAERGPIARSLLGLIPRSRRGDWGATAATPQSDSDHEGHVGSANGHTAGELSGMLEIVGRTNRVARIGFWEIDFANSRTTWSTVAREIHEMAPGVEPNATSAIDFHCRGPDRECIRVAMSAATAHGEPYDLELQITTSRGESRWVRTIGMAEMKDGRCQRLYGSVQDIDARIRAEETRLAQVRVEAAYRLRSQVLSELSHELRTPLNAVIGFAQLLAGDRDEPPSTRQKAHLVQIERAGMRLVDLIDEVLASMHERHSSGE